MGLKEKLSSPGRLPAQCPPKVELDDLMSEHARAVNLSAVRSDGHLKTDSMDETE